MRQRRVYDAVYPAFHPLLYLPMDYYQGEVSVPAKEYKLPMGELDTDFKKEFPPDPHLGHELDDGARVWKVYRKEATAYDNDMLDGWSGTLDILLIFAGLFSAVVTAFVIESYALLQPDNTAYMAAALYIIASANNASASLVLPPPPSLELSPSRSSRWINGLWFTSLLLSITVAFLCILIKQWIREYKSRNTASAQSPRHWARRREIFFKALKDWPIGELVSVLPVLLHLSLFLFFAGIIALLWPLDRAIGIWIVVLALILAVFYAGCTLIPVWIPECPTSTPLAHMVRKQLIPVALLVLRTYARALPRLQQYGSGALDILSRLVPRLGSLNATIAPSRLSAESIAMSRLSTRLDGLHTVSSSRRPRASRLQSIIGTLEAQRSADTYFSRWSKSNSDALDAAALQWAILEISDSDSVAVGLQALGALPLDSALACLLRQEPRLRTFTADTALTRTSGMYNAAEALRVVRSLLCMQGAEYKNDTRLRRDIASLDDNVLSKADYPDATLAHAFFNWGIFYVAENATAWRTASPTLTSTAMLLMQMADSEDLIIPLLLCCDLKQLLDVDWLYIIHNLSLFLAISQFAGGRHFGLRSKEISVAELVATAVFKRDSLTDLPTAAADIIGRLLLQIPHTDHALIAQCPSLLECMADGRFFSPEIDVEKLVEVLRIIGMCLPKDQPRQLWHAVAHAIHKLLPTVTNPWMVYSHTHHFCENALHAALAAPLQERDSRLSESLDLILYPMNIPDINRSIWSMLSIEDSSRTCGIPWLRLADTLSNALCAQELNDSHNAAYFAECNGANFLAATSSLYSTNESREVPVRVIQHNVELRSRWWQDILDSQLENNAYTEIIRALDKEFRRAPVCNNIWCAVRRLHVPQSSVELQVGST